MFLADHSARRDSVIGVDWEIVARYGEGRLKILRPVGPFKLLDTELSTLCGRSGKIGKVNIAIDGLCRVQRTRLHKRRGAVSLTPMRFLAVLFERGNESPETIRAIFCSHHCASDTVLLDEESGPTRNQEARLL